MKVSDNHLKAIGQIVVNFQALEVAQGHSVLVRS
jgi:hypothetical protein